MISRRRFLALTAASAGTGFLGAAQAFALEPRFGLVVKEWTVSPAGWPAAAPPLRIGILTDIHAVEPWMSARRIGAIAEELNAASPDIIVLLGDYVNALPRSYHSGEVAVSEWAAALRSLHAPLGVYAILGNHDCSSGDLPAIRNAFEKSGIALLENAAVKVRRGHDYFWLAGLADQLAPFSRGIADVRATLEQVRDRAPVILLAHEPDIFCYVPPSVTLTLAGHTHGGQVYIPFIGRPGLTAKFGRSAKYAYGHFEEEGRHMIVSSGLGLSGVPVRFLVPPEIALVTLRGRQSFNLSQSYFNS
jgi:hypothetical protein